MQTHYVTCTPAGAAAPLYYKAGNGPFTPHMLVANKAQASKLAHDHALCVANSQAGTGWPNRTKPAGAWAVQAAG